MSSTDSSASAPCVLPEQRFFAALLDPRTRLEYVQAGQSQAFPQWAVQRRVIQEHLLYLIVDHSCEGRVSGRNVRLEPGALVWVMPGVLHEFRIPENRPQFSMVHFKIGMYGQPRQRPLRLARPFLLLANAPELLATCSRAIREINSRSLHRELTARAALVLLFSEILALAQLSENSGGAFSPRQRQVLADYLQRNISQRPTPADLAAQLRLSHDYFARQFRETFGLSPRAWLVRQRMNAAAQRLSETTQTISEIAYALGFSDVFLFSRQFKSVFARSPRAFRRERGLG